jgi:hypothetical protein
MRRGDVKRAEEKRQQERQVREAKMHSIPFVKMEEQELLSLHICFLIPALLVNNLVFLYCSSDCHSGTKMATPRSLVKPRKILWTWTSITLLWAGRTGTFR